MGEEEEEEEEIREAEGDFQYHGRQNPLPSPVKILQSRFSKLDKMAREKIP